MARLAPSPGCHFAHDYPAQTPPPRHREGVTNVQRWKVLRDRNKNLPQLDFSYNAAGSAKKPQPAVNPAGSYSRSYTYDAIKLPYLTGSSQVTGASGTNDNSDITRRRDLTDTRGNIQVLVHYERWKCNTSHTKRETGSLIDLSQQTGLQLHNISPALSRSLTNLTESPEDSGPKPRHRYQRISCSKLISKRHPGTNKPPDTATKVDHLNKQDGVNKVDTLTKSSIADKVNSETKQETINDLTRDVATDNKPPETDTKVDHLNKQDGVNKVDTCTLKKSSIVNKVDSVTKQETTNDLYVATDNKSVPLKEQVVSRQQPHKDYYTKHSTKKEKHPVQYSEKREHIRHHKIKQVLKPGKLVGQTCQLNLLEKSVTHSNKSRNGRLFSH